ncbi:hypothetical protein, partial [Klebsiella pneumoniae]|uniref:hypothetical protein n=1 Tax=Klebsiella pneumoniae TaxID=573 RepID=UPI001D0F2D9B
KRAYCLKTQPATGETYPKSDLFNKAALRVPDKQETAMGGSVPAASQSCRLSGASAGMKLGKEDG